MSEEKTKKSQLDHAAKVLQSLLQNSKSPLSDQFIRWRLWNSWGEVVGSEIAKHSMPVGYKDATLYVWVKNAARMQEMVFLVKEIRSKINDYMGFCFVNSIRFTLDRKMVSPPQESAADLRDYLSRPLPNADEEPPRDL